MAKCCGSGKRLVYACSGGADVGEIADRVARKLVKEGFARPSCLAGVGGHVSGFVASALGDVENIVIDGCPVACAKKTLEHIEAKVIHYVLTDFGLNKGKTPPKNHIVDQIADKIIAISPVANGKPGTFTTSGCTCDSC